MVILIMPIFLVRVHRIKLKEIFSNGALVARLTPASQAFFFAPKHDARTHENHQIRVPIRAITVSGIDPATTAIDPVIDPISTTG